MRRRPPVFLALAVGLCLAAAVPPSGAGPAVGVPGRDGLPTLGLTGDWVLDPRASQPSPLPAPRPGPQDDPSRQLSPRIPAEDSVLPDPALDVDPATGQPSPVRRRPPSWLFRPERLEALRETLGEGSALSILQTPTYVDLRSARGVRSLEIGVASQVSLPTGELADQRVSWDGGRLVVERRVPRGARLVETYRLLPATGQLEWVLRRSSADGLPRIDWRRVFDRDPGDPERPEGPPAASSPPGPGR